MKPLTSIAAVACYLRVSTENRCKTENTLKKQLNV